jgi:hypothetical protein
MDRVYGCSAVYGATLPGTDLVQVGMANAAICDLDLNIIRAGLAAFDVDRLQRLVADMGTVGFGGYESAPCPWSHVGGTTRNGVSVEWI